MTFNYSQICFIKVWWRLAVLMVLMQRAVNQWVDSQYHRHWAGLMLAGAISYVHKLCGHNLCLRFG